MIYYRRSADEEEKRRQKPVDENIWPRNRNEAAAKVISYMKYKYMRNERRTVVIEGMSRHAREIMMPSRIHGDDMAAKSYREMYKCLQK